MPATTLDPKSAQIVVDLRKGVVAMPTARPIGGVVARASRLAAGFRRLGETATTDAILALLEPRG